MFFLFGETKFEWKIESSDFFWAFHWGSETWALWGGALNINFLLEGPSIGGAFVGRRWISSRDLSIFYGCVFFQREAKG